MAHPAFTLKNPNRVRVAGRRFCPRQSGALPRRHGAGYRFLADQVLDLDPLNPQVAARLLSALSRWRRFDMARQALMKRELARIAAKPNLSRDVFEIVSKSLA